MKKKELRFHAKKIRGSMPKDAIGIYSRIIQNRLLLHPWYQEAHTVFTYVSMTDEVQTHDFIVSALKNQKIVCVPKVYPGKHMTAVQITDMPGDLELGFYNVLEPKDALQHVSENEVDLVIVPGLLFDREGYRIGYGGGYYDKYLKTISPQCKTIGLAYSGQIVDRLPHEEHDMRIMMVITEKKMIG